MALLYTNKLLSPFYQNVREVSVLVGHTGNRISEHMCVGESICVYGKGYGFEHLRTFPVTG